jgi:hypothetical protein
MQETKSIDIKLTSAIQKLQDAALKKVEEVKRLENKITKLSIENAKLQAIIEDIKPRASVVKQQEVNAPGILPFGNIESGKLLSQDASEDIDMSISQLKSVFSKNQNK